MAGLQYYFFPTDFLYPRTSSANGDSTSKPAVLHVQPDRKVDTEGKVREDNKLCYQASSSSSTALVPSPCIIKSELRRKKPTATKNQS